jgi:hypothetical protein
VTYGPADLPGFLAEGAARGATATATFRVGPGDCQLVTLDGVEDEVAVTAVLDRVAAEAAGWGCGRVWTAVPNDDTDTIRILQVHGWDLVALHWGALAPPRPGGATAGAHGIPRRHELELERRLDR